MPAFIHPSAYVDEGATIGENTKIWHFCHVMPRAIAGKRTFRSLTMNDELIEFSDGFTELHTHSYQRILEGNGFTLQDARPAVVLAHDIRFREPVGLQGEYHPFAALPLSKHPFSV